MRPRVVQVITHLDLGGAEQVAISLAEALHAEYDFTFFAVQGVSDTAVGREMARRLAAIQVPVVSGTRLSPKRGGLVQAGLRLGSFIRRTRPALVHLHTEIPETAFAVASLGGLPPGTRIVRTVHNQTLWPMWRRVGWLVERRLGMAEAVAVSRAGIEGLREFQSAMGVPPTPAGRQRVVYNGVAVRNEQPRHPLGDRPVRVLFAGRFEEQKGADLLPAIVEAASAQTDRAVDLTLTGSGSMEANLRRWVEAARTPWTVRLQPPVADLPAQLADYDLVLMPSRFEGLGLVAVEAILAGTPVIASRAPGLSEVFPAQYPLFAENGNVADLARVLAGAITDIDVQADTVRAYRPLIAEKFSMAGMADGYRHCYANGPVPLGAVAVP